MMKITITELGCPGHFCGAVYCRWRRHTQVGAKYRVSSVGNYFPPNSSKRRALGADNNGFFETMVFETLDTVDIRNEQCGCFAVKSYSEIDGARYATAGEAQNGHERMIEKYRALCYTQL